MSVKLNIGSGSTEIEGFTPIDRKLGLEAYPLKYEDNSVDEIRASHILEHFPRAQVDSVIRDWVRVLKPGARLRIAVPDFDKLDRTDPKWEAHLMGGQSDQNDYHHTVWTEPKLRSLMTSAGIAATTISPWVSKNTDCASLPVSLNLEGTKSHNIETETEVKVQAIMSVPRYGSLASRGIMQEALGAHGIPLQTSQGVFWGQCIQRMFEDAVRDNIDIIIAFDFDTLCTADQVATLLKTIVSRDDIDCLAALEARRDNDKPLMTFGESTAIEIDGLKPHLATSAHFGMTAIRVENLRDLPKPWFYGQHDNQGEWGDDRLDPDIWFWHQWRKAGHNIYVDPQIRIGHLEESCSYYDAQLKIQRCSIPEWRKRFLK